MEYKSNINRDKVNNANEVNADDIDVDGEHSIEGMLFSENRSR